MRFRFIAVVTALALLALGTPTSLAQGVQRTCQGVYAGQPLQGVLQLERWVRSETFQYYGVFRDSLGNTYELQVVTADLAGGTGSVWVNSARHRETYMTMQVFQNGFVVRTEDGVVVEFECR